ncbi:helix-turn-helix transcriptional regulator [[Actinomadura] parvosata]|nr:helix-turn-helix transcriptional regulator [Nonomuraea sp. ATCC 55076]
MRDEFGQFVAAARNKLGLRQEDVAQRLGVSTGTISNLENGHRRPKGGQWKTLASILEVSWQELMDRAIGFTDPVERAIASSELDRAQQDALLMTYGCFTGRDSLEEVTLLRHRDRPEEAEDT